MGRLIDADAFFDNLDAYSDKNKLQKNARQTTNSLQRG